MAKLLTNTRIYGTGTVDTQLFVKGFQSAHSTSTGALQVSGGIGVAGGGFFSGAVTATTFVGNISGASASLSGGTAGQIPYQVSPNTTDFFGPGTAGQILVSAGTSAPTYTNTASIYVGNAVTATNVRGGAVDQFIYQSAPGITAFINTGSMYVGNAVISTNLRGGTAGQFAYQTGPNTTAFINTGSMYVNRAVIADTVVGGTGFINTVQQTANASYYLTFVDSNNSVATAENVFTTSSFVVNPGTGNVGIGTASPQTALHISSLGTVKLKITADTDNVTEADVAGIELSQDGGITTANFGLDDNNHLVIGANSTTAPNIYIGTRSDGTNFAAAGDARITILNGGNVGVGVAPSYKLDVDGVIQGRQGLRTGLGYNSYVSDRLQFAASTGFSHHQFKQVDPGGGSTRLDLRRYTGSGDGFDGGEMMTFLNNGYVGINITTPTSRLHVNGDVRVNGVVTATTFVGNLTGSVSQVTTQQRTTNAAHYLTFVDSNNGSATAETLYTNSSFVVNPGTGNVGIGTTGPAYRLDIQGGSVRIGDATYNANLLFGNNQGTWGSGIRVYDNSDAEMRIWHMNGRGQIVLATGYNGNGSVTLPTDGLFIIGDTTASPALKVGVGYTAANMRGGAGKFSVNGRVGIGVANPSATLQVYETATTGSIRIGGGNGASNHRIFIQADPTAAYIDSYGNNSYNKLSIEANPLILNSNGSNVGIGVSTSANKLQIGSVGSSGYGGNDLAIGNGTQVMAFFQSSSASLWYTNINFELRPSGSGSTGNVGLNTTPSFRLDINGTARASSDFRAPIFYDTADTGFFADPASTSIFKAVRFGGSLGNYSISLSTDATYAPSSVGRTAANNEGIFWHTSASNYAIYRTAGAWTASTYQQLRLDWPTGIILSTSNIGTYTYSYVDVTSTLSARGDVRAPIFYDSNDTNYYVDPASTSRVNTLQFASGATGGPYFYYGNNRRNLYLQGADSTDVGLSIFDSAGTWRVQIYGSSGNYGFLNANWASWDIRKVPSGNLFLNNQSTYYINGSEIYYNRVYGVTDIRSPIFYDNNNTAFYTDPASTSRLNIVTLEGITSQDTRAAATTPQTYNNIVRWDFKTNTTNGLSDGGTYNGVMYWRKYGSSTDWSGGGAVELAYTDNARMWMRYGSSTTWGSWKRFIFGDNFDNGGIIRTSGGMSAANFYDGTGTYNVNLGSGGSEGRGLVAGYSGGSYGGIGYNIRHTTTGGTYIAPGGDTSSYLDFRAGGFFFLGAGSGTAGRTLSFNTNGSLNNSGTLSIRSDVRAPIFYDSNDTAFYTDPASTSILNATRHNSIVTGSTSAMSSAGTLAVYRSSSPFISFHDGTTSRTAYFQETGGRFYCGEVTYTETEGSFRAPIFYDSNDTTVRWDGNYIVLRGTSPTVYLRDTDHNSAMLHCNSNIFYVLRGGNDTESWSTVNGYWPMEINLTNNNALFGNNITAIGTVGANRYADQGGTFLFRTGSSSGATRHLNLADSTADPSQVVSEGNGTGISWGQRGDNQPYYFIRQSYRNFGGSTYTKLTLNWHTGLILGSNAAYGGTRFYADAFPISESLLFYINGPSNYTYKYTWMYTNTTGIYSDSNGAHIYPNTASSYTQWRIDGSRGSYGGIYDSYSQVHGIMYDSGGNGGVYRQANGRWYWYHNLGNNSMGIGSSATSSSHRLYINDNSFIANMYANAFYYASDRKFKDNINTIGGALDLLGKFRGVTYTKKDDEEKKLYMGVIAQEVEEIFPSLVNKSKDHNEEEYLSVNYGNFAGLFIEAIKEQNTIINSLKEEIALLKKKLGV